LKNSPGTAAEAAARALIASGHLPAALDVLAGVEGQDPHFSETALLAAAILHHLGRTAEASVPLSQILVLNPVSAAALSNLALVAPFLNRQQAFRFHQRAAVAAPMDEQVLVNAGTASIGLGAEPQAIAYFARVLTMNPTRSEAVAAFGMIEAARNQMARAGIWYRRAISVAPVGPMPHFVLASTLQAQNKFDEAEAEFAHAAVLKWHTKGRLHPAPARLKRLGLGWKPGYESGWDVYGANLVKRLTARGDIEPVAVNPIIAGPIDSQPFHDLFDHSLPIVADALASGRRHDFTGLIGLGNDFARFPCLGRCRREVGVIFLEDTRLSDAGRARAHAFDHIIAGATWGAQILAGHGLTNVTTVLQGIDPSLFHANRRTNPGARFRIFSGGKLEFRKGQDLVLAAFKRFHARHPDSQLVVSWASPWHQVAKSITWGGIVDDAPDIGPNSQLDLAGWLAKHGLEGDAVDILGLIPNYKMPEIYSNVDCALFPNRCEGGTNLVAMEAMASGVPVILSANTGHLDLMTPDNCLPLTRQSPVTAPIPMGLDGWGNSDLDEIVGHLETLYHDRALADVMGQRGAQRLAQLSWSSQIDALVQAIGPL
jgi:glycosyltransferase involved in cell wall biosynthesis/Flp pilus assembly protein TadD